MSFKGLFQSICFYDYMVLSYQILLVLNSPGVSKFQRRIYETSLNSGPE